ncbi:MAG: siroheme synthase CysG [Pseudomonadota bacterium]
MRQPTETRLRRMAALSSLPVFFGLKGKRVVVAGGGEGAAWKAELLAAAGAHVDVYAEDASGEMTALLERGAAAGTIALKARPWTSDCLGSATLAICDAATDGEARAFACAAKAAGVPANVIDKPAYCTFQFGSIVNRSPVVVGISTDGAAPILGQAIRRRIDTLLPPTLADWAALAATLRARVAARFRPGAERRAFWERLTDRAFDGQAPAQGDGERLLTTTHTSNTGKVTLVGAGPGDPGLLTLNAVRALQASDVILFDDLVSAEVLELARREAKRIAVGKRGARESCRQDDITNLMIRLAKAGRSVVRLKAGDPSVFGRAGEEIAALRDEGIPVDVVPGITSASAMAAKLKVSLTHRDHAQVLTLVTGHARDGRVPEGIAFGQLLDKGRTTIVYMGGRTCREWVEGALQQGIDPRTPAVAMTAISRPDEEAWSGPLAALPDAVATLGDAPLLIGVGGVFKAAGVGEVPMGAPANVIAAANGVAHQRLAV